MKEITLLTMIGIDFVSHILETFYQEFFIFQWWKSLINFIGYNNFWIIWWWIGFMLAVFIYRDSKINKYLKTKKT